jgi:hypothetical protein
MYHSTTMGPTVPLFEYALDFARNITLQFVDIAKDMNQQGSKKASSSASPQSEYPLATRLLARGEMPIDDLTETVGDMLLAGVDTMAYVHQSYNKSIFTGKACSRVG